MTGLKKQIERIIIKRYEDIDITQLYSFRAYHYRGYPTEYSYSKKEAFEVAKNELISDLESHDIEWATNIYYPLKNESRLKKEIISFIENLDY